MRRDKHLRYNQGGFTIIELMVAFALIAIMFLGLGAALMGAMAGTADSRRNQQSADVMAELVEGTRSADFASVAIRTPGASDPTLLSDSAVTQVAGNYFADVNGAKVGGVEPMIVDPAGVVIAQQTLVRDGTTYTVHSYVTTPVGAQNYKRLTTVVQWKQAGLTHSRRTSTFIAETQRGLPLPDFVWKSAMTGLPGGDNPTVDNTSKFDLFLSLTNRGARDAWKIDVSGKPWSWEYNQSTGPDTSNLTPLVSQTTPLIATDGSIFVNIHVESLPSGIGGPFPITVRATSVAQPSVYKEVVFNVTVVKDCTGCTYVPLFLHNTSTSAGCTGTPCTDPSSNRVTTDLYADFVAPKWTGTQPDFDKDVLPFGPGRWLLPGGAIATEPTTSGKLMQWRWDAGSTQLDIVPGKDMKMTVCMQNLNLLTGTSITWQVLAQKTSGSPVAVTPVTTTSLDASGLTTFACTIAKQAVNTPPSGTTWVLKGTGSNYRKLFLRIVNPSLGAYALAYDSSTYATTLDLPTP